MMAGTSKRLLGRVLAIGENRLELLAVEGQEERERFLHALLLALGTAAFGLLAGLALTAAIVVLLWEHSPLSALLVLATLYSASSVWMYARLLRLRADWQTLPATLGQLKKDRQCLERILR